MCMHVKEEKVNSVVLKELRLLQNVIEEIEMSVVSSCLECIRMGRDNRYASLVTSYMSGTNVDPDRKPW